MEGKVKKAFLQACINHGCLSTEEVQEILESMCTAFESETYLNNVHQLVKDLNVELREFNQELNFVQHPLVNKEFLVFGLTLEMPACKYQHHYTEADQLYFAKLLDTLARQDDYCVSWLDVFNLPDMTPTMKKHLPKTRMQELIQKWTMQGYLVEIDDKLYFGPRMIVEYASHLRTNYTDLVSDCPLCKKIVLWDTKCSECGAKIHLSCIKTFLKRNSNCPACNEIWNTPLNENLST